jgi:hypothetical protein
MPRKEILDRIEKYVDPFRITKGKGFKLADFDPGDTRGLRLDKGEAAQLLQRGKRRIIALRCAMRWTPMASVIVISAGSPSGISDTAMPTTA